MYNIESKLDLHTNEVVYYLTISRLVKKNRLFLIFSMIIIVFIHFFLVIFILVLILLILFEVRKVMRKKEILKMRKEVTPNQVITETSLIEKVHLLKQIKRKIMTRKYFLNLN